MIGSDSFDEKNEDWACNEIFTTRDNPFKFKCEGSWERIEKISYDLIKEYLTSGLYKNKLENYKAITTGFVDGNLKRIK